MGFVSGKERAREQDLYHSRYGISIALLVQSLDISSGVKELVLYGGTYPGEFEIAGVRTDSGQDAPPTY